MNPFSREMKYDFKVDLGRAVDQFTGYLKSNGWKVQSSVQGDRAVVQAQKGGILRDIIAAERALTFTLDQTSGKLVVKAGIGKWIQNIGVMALEVILLSELFLVVDVPEMLWNEHVEKTLLAKLDEIVRSSVKS
ncbi:hypothetical protein [Conexivisphaera calida]|uniref:Uncharacterized protein n=1 Tax=Conexivisphaera calida TaxID=1874277 RepID=A0A4P2VDR5_9ARCH|nr:hypothetical protein [Conexivisphaera calida]BBE42271.1 hypothetical protein NAS2_0882 [Conexivisphaera calida]